jgi:peptide subunit release factor 1 (eRF1)
MRALANGQVDELLITAQMEQQHPAPESVSAELTPELADLETPGPEDTKQVLLADELVTRARQTGAHVTFIEDPALLADVEGIAATLRFKLQNEGEADKQEHRRQ